MDSRVGKNPENELEQQIPNCCFQFSHHAHVHLSSFLAPVFNKIPTDPHGNYGCHLWLSPPCLCNCSDCGNQVFLIFNSKSLVLTPAIGDNQKCRSPQQADLFMSNPPDVPSFPPSGQRTQKECLFFKIFFITRPTDNTLFCSTVKLRKLKCTR